MKPMTIRITLLIVAVTSSCTVVDSRLVQRGLPVSENGVSYFLPTARVHLAVDHRKSGTTEVTVEPLVVPDVNHLYYAQIQNSWLSKDNVKLTVANGLLRQVSSTATDQTAVVAKNLAVTVKNIIKLAAIGAGGGEDDAQDLRVDLTFDPFDASAVAEINKYLGRIGGELSPLRCPLGVKADPIQTPQDGLLYRPAFPYELRLAFTGDRFPGFNPAPPAIKSFPLNLPSQCSPILSLDVDRTAFGKNVTTINFENGMLQDVTVDKDSELAGLSQIPVDITGELLTLPEELLTLRYNNTSKQDTLVNGQATLLNDQVKLIKAQQDFNTAMAAAKSPAPSPSPSPTPAPAQPVVDASPDQEG